MISEIVIPKLGGTGGDVVLDKWLVKPGDFVREGSPLMAVTTDKANVEVESYRDGFVRAIFVSDGVSVPLGTVVGLAADSMDEPLGDISQYQITPGGDELKHVEALPLPHEDVGTKPAGVQEKNSVAERSKMKDEAPAGVSPSLLLEMYRRMVLIRRFEDHLYRLFLQGLVPSTLHQYQGQEAVGVGVCSALRADDLIFSTHRPVGHFIAKGSPLRGIAAEIWGKATGCAAGKGGQMHLTDVSVGAYPSNAIVGANIPIATGAALAFKLRGLDNVAVSFFGDGGANIGAFHEGVNLAAVKNAPVVFVCENNLYAASTHIAQSSRVTSIADRAESYGIPGVRVDGMDVLTVYRAASEAVGRAREGSGPTLLECMTYRYSGHSRGDPGGYRTKEEVKSWRDQDPIPRCRGLLLAAYGQSDESLERIERECQSEVEDAVEFARSSPDPDPTTCYENVYAQ